MFYKILSSNLRILFRNMFYKENHRCWEIEMSNTDKASIQMSFFQNAERQFSRMSNENTMGKTIKKNV